MYDVAVKPKTETKQLSQHHCRRTWIDLAASVPNHASGRTLSAAKSVRSTVRPIVNPVTAFQLSINGWDRGDFQTEKLRANPNKVQGVRKITKRNVDKANSPAKSEILPVIHPG